MKPSPGERKRLMERVRKLLALSESPNENEAAFAAAKAKELLERYNLSISDLEVDDIVEKGYDTGRVRMATWLLNLAASVARGFDCDIYYTRGGGKRVGTDASATSRITFVGTDMDTEVAEYVFEYLRVTVERMTAEKVRNIEPPLLTGWFGNIASYRLKMRNSYMMGLVSALDRKIREFAEPAAGGCCPTHSASSPDEMQLVAVKERAIGEYMKRLKLRKGRRSSTSLLADGFNDGVNDGRGVSIKKGLRAKKNSAPLLT
jgi:hypothetical protein